MRFYDNERKAYILLKQFQGEYTTRRCRSNFRDSYITFCSITGDREVKVGEYDGVTDILDLNKGEPLIWKGKSPPKDRTLHIIEHSTVNITIYAVLTSAASVGITMAAIFLVINIKYRNQRWLRSTGIILSFFSFLSSISSRVRSARCDSSDITWRETNRIVSKRDEARRNIM